MRLKHFDYITLVIEAYNKKRANNRLSPLLAQSTPGNIRRECANVYQERYEKKDEPALRAFFGPAEHGKKFLAVIQKFDVNRFKPLDKYLKVDSKKRISDRNLELLAWLIDFKHRPYSSDNDVQLTDEELYLIKDSGEKQPEPPETFPEKETGEVPGKIEEELVTPLNANSKNDKARKRFKKAVIVFLILIICTGGVYTIWQQRDKQTIMGNTNTGCMYWANDHYEKVPCNEQPKGRLILPLNEEKWKNFKKITRIDSITEWSIGKIYYIKDSNTIKCYTEGGSYPEDVTRNLKPLSRHIFDKYLRKKGIPNKDSLAEQ